MKKVVKCIRKENSVEISDTIASKSEICKEFGARWDRESKIWTWKPSQLYPTFDVDVFLDKYVSGSYNVKSDASYWEARKKVDLINAKIEIEKDRWKKGEVSLDENSTEEEQQSKRQLILCPTRRNDVFVFSYGEKPCCCKTCRINKTTVHYVGGGQTSTFGYIIGKKKAVEEIVAMTPEPNRYIYHPDTIIDLSNGRAVALYTFFDTVYE